MPTRTLDASATGHAIDDAALDADEHKRVSGAVCVSPLEGSEGATPSRARAAQRRKDDGGSHGEAQLEPAGRLPDHGGACTRSRLRADVRLRSREGELHPRLPRLPFAEACSLL